MTGCHQFHARPLPAPSACGQTETTFSGATPGASNENLAPSRHYRRLMLLAVVMASAVDYEDMDAPSFLEPNDVDAKLQKIYGKSYGKFTQVQLYITRAKEAGKSYRWIEYVLNNCSRLEELRFPFPDDANRHYSFNHVSIATAVRFTLRGCRWIPGRIGHTADAVSQDSIADGIVYACEHPDGVDPLVFVDYIFSHAAMLFGSAEIREMAERMEVLDWWHEMRDDMLRSNRDRKGAKRWIRRHDLRLSLGIAIEEERLNFATVVVIGRWFDRFGTILTSVNPRLRFNYDETMLAASLSRSKVVVVLDQRVFRRKHKKPHHFTLGAVFNPFGHGPSPLVVVPTFSTAEELFAGQRAFIRESRSGWCTGPIFAAFAAHFCSWLAGYRAEIGVPADQEAVLILDNAQIHANAEAIRVFRENNVRVITLPAHCTHCMQPVGVSWAKSFKAHFSRLVVSKSEEDIMQLLGMLLGGHVTESSEAMKERCKFVMCGLDAYQMTTTWSTCAKAFRVTGLHPFNPQVVLDRQDVRKSSDDPETQMQLKHPERAFTGSQELTSDSWQARVWEVGSLDGIPPGDAEGSTLLASEVTLGDDKLVRVERIGTYHGHDGDVQEGGPPQRRRPKQTSRRGSSGP